MLTTSGSIDECEALGGNASNEKLLRKAALWGSLQIVKKLVDDDGPISKKEDMIRNRGDVDVIFTWSDRLKSKSNAQR